MTDEHTDCPLPLDRLAGIDALTGLPNRRGLTEHIAREVSRAQRTNTPICAILLDIDHFTDVNNTYGRVAGDRVLREIGTLLRSTVRLYDVVARWGGDEFLIVLSGADIDQGRSTAERIRQAVRTHTIDGIGSITASCGLAAYDAAFDDGGDMLRRVERQLNQSKRNGDENGMDPRVREPRKRDPDDRDSAAAIDEP